jgi:hypothetical protein
MGAFDDVAYQYSAEQWAELAARTETELEATKKALAKVEAWRVCCIERSQVIFTGRFAVGTALGALRSERRDLVSTGWRHSEGLPAGRFPAKITSDRSMQQTRRGCPSATGSVGERQLDHGS